MAAVSIVLQVLTGTNDDDEYTLRVVKRIARRQGGETRTDAPGIVFLEIDGLALPILRSAMRDGSAPNLARWIAEDGYRLTEWETDLSSQTGASQAGILLGSNEDIPAFRWVEKETQTMMTCSAPDDCAEIERRRATGIGLLADGGASRGNLLSGEADEVILTVSRIEAEKRANPGYRAFLANGFNVTRTLVLFVWEVVLEWTAAIRAIRRDVRPRGHRGGIYPFLRGGDVRDRPRPDRLRRAHRHDARPARGLRDLLQLRRGRPPLRASSAPTRWRRCASSTSSSAASSARARYAPRPYEIVVLSDHGQTQGATFKQRNGYGLDELVERSLAGGRGRRVRRRRRAVGDGRPRARRGDRARAGRSGRRTTSPTARSSSSARATSGSST